MSALIPIVAQFLMGWLKAKCGGTDPKSAVTENYDPDIDKFDEDFIRAGRTKAKRAVRKLHRDDPTQPKRVSVEELDAIVEAHYRTALDTPDADLAVMCAAIQPLSE